MSLVNNDAKICADLISKAENIVALTGAGISTNAGIPDFRGPKGLYVTKQYNPETIFDINYFLRNPLPFFDFARDFISLEGKIKPTFAHRFLSALESKNSLKGIVTQNIDSLHHLAGSTKVLEMHGSFWESHCLLCRKSFDYSTMKEKIFQEDVPSCSCGGTIKPDVVFFGEDVKFFEESINLANESDLFLIIGTSCVVYPAALVPQYSHGNIITINQTPIEINLKNTALTANYDIDTFLNEVNKSLCLI